MKIAVDAAEALHLGSAVVGGKAFALAEMHAAGFNVPPFVVLLPEALATGVTSDNITPLVAALPGTRFAVRSSGRMEDGAEDSHAGQFLTVLEVPREGIADAAARVFASGRAASVASYRAARGRVGLDAPAVVVQSMVPARTAGVAFAADPVSGRRDRVVVSAVIGLGEALVSGEENGETWMLALPELAPLDIPAVATVLHLEEAQNVARLCLKASEARGAPQDIEWAFAPESAEPLLLQARPITTKLLPPAATESMLSVFDNSNIVESYPGLIAPLTFSFAVAAYDRVYRAFLKLVGVSDTVIRAHAAELANMLTLIDGRMYYNLGNWYRLLSLLPFFSGNRAYMETMMGVAEPLPDEAMTGIAPSLGLSSKLRMALGLGWAAWRLPRLYRDFMRRVAEAVPAKADPAALAVLPLSRLVRDYRRVEDMLLDRWDAPIVNDFLCMMAFGGSRKLLQRWAGAEGLRLHNDVMIGQGDIVSAEPARLIREAGALARGLPGAAEALKSGAAFELPGLGDALRAYIAKFGDRRIGELKLEQPTLGDDPAPLLQAVLAAMSPHGKGAAHCDAEAVLKEMFRSRPLKRMLARRVLSYAKARVRDRENLRFERTRIFGHARRLFHAMGGALAAQGRLVEAGDIFFLTVGEVLSAAEGGSVTADLAALAALRRKEQNDFAALPDPPPRILARGAPVAGNRLSHALAPEQNNGEPARNGTPCGGGRAEGIVRVIRDPTVEQLQPGEVLVARNTDPGWISHFTHAAAVVVERGSVLSHSAIVSRELGIPCVVAVSGVCGWLKTGERVTVDGGSGRIEKLP
jgi:rifampicin phosphotransferase